MSEPRTEPDPAPRRRWHLRTWEVVVIGIAIALFITAAFAGPGGEPGPTSASPPAGARAVPDPGVSPIPTVTAVIPRDAQGRVGTPVATVEQVLVEEVGDYTLFGRGISGTATRGGALQSAELRYVLDPQTDSSDIYHGVEVHLDAQEARDRVLSFGSSLAGSGFRVTQRQPLRSPAGSVQGAFLELRGQGQRFLLWSNRNVMFSLGGGADADLDMFYEALPY
jgi:hypothetical protein